MNIKDNYQKTPLHYTYDPTLTKILLDNGADINAKENSGYTPLEYWIIRSFKTDNLEVLINRGAGDLNFKDKQGGTLLYYIRDPVIAKLILDKNPKLIDNVDNDGNTVLHYHLKNSNLNAIPNLIKLYDSKINEQNNDGNTTLHVLIERLKKIINISKNIEGIYIPDVKQMIEIIKLLNAKADHTIKNKENKTAKELFETNLEKYSNLHFKNEILNLL